MPRGTRGRRAVSSGHAPKALAQRSGASRSSSHACSCCGPWLDLNQGPTRQSGKILLNLDMHPRLSGPEASVEGGGP